MHATTPKGNMGYDQYIVSKDCSCRTYFCCFLLALANVCPWPLVLFFQNSLENRADKTTHNTFRDCRVHFFRQPFSKQLYTTYCFGRVGHWFWELVCKKSQHSSERAQGSGKQNEERKFFFGVNGEFMVT